MKIRLLNLLLIGSIVSSVMLSSCNKDDVPSHKNPDYSQDKGEFKDSRDSRTYKWVKIGDQVWMAENLAYTGTGIQHIIDGREWISNSDYNAWCYYNNSDSLGQIYGVLYQFEAARSACPNGWHLPNNSEWTKLEQFIDSDGNSRAALRALSGWDNGGGGTDDYGFSALPGGVRGEGGGFRILGLGGDWWSATEDGSCTAYRRYLGLEDAAFDLEPDYKSGGFSVRCVKD